MEYITYLQYLGVLLGGWICLFGILSILGFFIAYILHEMGTIKDPSDEEVYQDWLKLKKEEKGESK